MKNIFKIIEYLPDTEQIVVRYARKNTHRDIAVSYTHLTLPTR